MGKTYWADADPPGPITGPPPLPVRTRMTSRDFAIGSICAAAGMLAGLLTAMAIGRPGDELRAELDVAIEAADAADAENDSLRSELREAKGRRSDVAPIRAAGWREDFQRTALACPPIVWSCAEAGISQRKMDLWKWSQETRWLVPEVYPLINGWLESAQTELGTIITNGPTGAQYRISGRKEPGGVACEVTFVGNVRWN